MTKQPSRPVFQMRLSRKTAKAFASLERQFKKLRGTVSRAEIVSQAIISREKLI